MRGTVLYGPRDIRSEERPDPTIIEPTDAIIRLAATCVCGSDLWPYRGVDPVTEPRPMGHEYVGIVEAVGREVRLAVPQEPGEDGAEGVEVGDVRDHQGVPEEFRLALGGVDEARDVYLRGEGPEVQEKLARRIASCKVKASPPSTVTVAGTCGCEGSIDRVWRRPSGQLPAVLCCSLYW